ncbi:centrosomal protein of 120 kDa [Nilaparvata lugens]|uniref:centrosomal protein of 120 kDa n=1 Tax=Nilaparvata lugens TaxID=108931 RepID=UPI00193D9999|nr:centrosomal protein of 120 kDa [Nilaparvata lugens]
MTSNDRSAWAQIVLNIQEGHGLGTTNLPLVIVANLNKNRLESDVIHSFSTKLEVEFVWEGEMKEVKRLKQANTSIKVECFSVLNTQKREKMGYVVLSLRQAVLIPRDKKNATVESWHKLMGVKPEMKKSEPKLLLTLSLQEKPEQFGIKNIVADTPVEKEGKEEISSLIAEKKTTEAPAPKSDNPTSSLQAEVILETNRIVTMDKEEVKYGPITGRDDDCNRVIHHYSLRISFEYVRFTTPSTIERIYIRVNHKSAEVLCTGCGEIDVSNISDIDAELRLKSSADQIDSLLMSDSLQVQLYDATGVVASAILDLGDVSTKTEPKSHESDLICHKSKQKIGVLAARLSLRDCGVLLQQARYENDTETQQPMKNMTFDRSVAQRIVEELEDWKERQQELFLIELKKKESDHLARLTAESIKRRKEMEDNLYENMNKYEAMAAALNEANEKIKEVALQNEDKARQLKLEEDDLHRKFNSKLQELREASKRMEADVNHKLNMASTERNELVDKLNHMLKAEKRSEKVKSALEEEIENLRVRTVSKEEFEKVTQTLRNVEVSLNSALESKAFYKSQWGKAVREIHRLKKELQDAMDQQLQRERLEVFKMKLSQQAKEQEEELVTDRLVLTNLQKETQDFIMKKCSTYS